MAFSKHLHTCIHQLWDIVVQPHIGHLSFFDVIALIAHSRYSIVLYGLLLQNVHTCNISKKLNEHSLNPRVRGGGVLPYLVMVGRSRGDDPRFGDFRSDWVPILYFITIRLTPSFCRKNRFVSITFSSRDTRTKIWYNFSSKCII